MRRTATVGLVILLLLPLAAVGQGSIELSDLHLLSWEEVPAAGPEATGAVASAILMAWHATHGYPLLLPDLTGDGRADREDTLRLAEEFLDPMDAHRGPILDPPLVDVLASYIADRYPEHFEMLIYDPSFPQEWRDVMGRSFDAAIISGIQLIVQEEPDHGAYVEHLENNRSGIVGMGGEDDPNVYAVSRSARLEETGSGWPVDLANTSRDAFGPGDILDTWLRQGAPRWRFDVLGGIPFETLIVPVPVRQAEGDPGDPEPTALPNLWVTNMTGCWTWSNDNREHVVATVTGVVHNGGQAAASGVVASVTAGNVSTMVAVGQRTVSATIDVGPYDTTSWPVPTSITANPYDQITEADETNNSTDSAFPQSSECH